MAQQPRCRAEPQSGSAERLAAFRHHIIIIMGVYFVSASVYNIVNGKMDKNEAKYPVEKAQGSNLKYDQLLP